MRKLKLFTICLIIILVLTQVSMVLAAPSSDVADSVSGTVVKIVYETAEGEGTVWVTLSDGKVQTTYQLAEQDAIELHLLAYDYDQEAWVPNSAMVGAGLEIPADYIVSTQQDEMMHPVGSALATYFSPEIDGVDYALIMQAHTDGYGFGVIAQALWLTKKLGGDSSVLLEILDAKKSGNYTYFDLPDGSHPTNWGQFKNAVMDGDKKGNLGVVMSGKEKDKSNNGNGGSHENPGNNGNKDNPDKSNNGNNGNSGSNGNNGNKGKP